MGEVEQVTTLAKGIGDYGMMAVSAAFFLLLSASVMIALFNLFKGLLNERLEEQRSCQNQLLEEVQTSVALQRGLMERMQPETLLRIRNLSGFAFDLSVEQVCRLIKRVRKENHIVDREATVAKIRKSLQVIHEDRCSRFDTFTFRGKPLSEYCDDSWVDEVAAVVIGEIYQIGRAHV